MPKKHESSLKKHHFSRSSSISKAVTSKRLIIRKTGVFAKGCSSKSILRDSKQYEEAQARAEEQLSKILNLARTSKTDKSDPYSFEDHEHSPILPRKAYRKKKRKSKSSSLDSIHQKGSTSKKTSKLTNSSCNLENSYLSLNTTLHHNEPTPKTLEEKEPKNTLHENFFECITNGLHSLAEQATEDITTELSEKLTHLCSESRLIVTPPSIGMQFSDFLEIEKDSPDLPLEEKGTPNLYPKPSPPTSISHYADNTIGSPSKICPSIFITRYERARCKQSSKAIKKPHSEKENLDPFASSRKRKYENIDNETFQITKQDISPKCNPSYLNSINFLKRYEIQNAKVPKIDPLDATFKECTNFNSNPVFSESGCHQLDRAHHTNIDTREFSWNKSMCSNQESKGCSSFSYNPQPNFSSTNISEENIFPLPQNVPSHSQGHIPFSLLPKPPSPNVFSPPGHSIYASPFYLHPRRTHFRPRYNIISNPSPFENKPFHTPVMPTNSFHSEFHAQPFNFS